MHNEDDPDHGVFNYGAITFVRRWADVSADRIGPYICERNREYRLIYVDIHCK